MSEEPLWETTWLRKVLGVAIGDWVRGLLLATVVLAAFFPAISGGLLWNDDTHVTKPDLRSLYGLWLIWSEPRATEQYYPLLHGLFWIEYKLWDEYLPAYHLVGIGLHIACCLLLVALIRQLKLPGAWIAGFIFAVHPVCVESVAWITVQKNTLSLALLLLSALTYLRFDDTRRRAFYGVAFALFVLALLSKSVTATLPGAILVILWWQRGTLRWKEDVLPLLPWFAVGATMGLITESIEQRNGAYGEDYALSPLERCLVAGRAITFYAFKDVWPSNLIMMYPRWTVDTGAWWQYIFPLLVVLVGGCLYLVARRVRGPLAIYLLFIGVLSPALGFVNVYEFVFSYVADRFQYHALPVLIVPFACLTGAFISRASISSRVFAISGIATLVCLLGILSWIQAHEYKTSADLYRAVLRENPDCWMAENNLGIDALTSNGSLDDAIAYFTKALAMKPDLAEAHCDLGYALMKKGGDPTQAIVHLKRAIELNPNSYDAHFDLGNAFEGMPGHLNEAIEQYELSLKINPYLVKVRNSLGNLFRAVSRPSEAIAQFNLALDLAPNSAELHTNLGNAYLVFPNGAPAALNQFRAALALNPNLAEAHLGLGNVYTHNLNLLPMAATEYESAIRLKADYAEAYYNLGIVLLHLPGREKEAPLDFEYALRANPHLDAARRMLVKIQSSETLK